MWQAVNVSDYRDAAAKIVQLATSQHVSAATVNAGGTGYTVGDVLTVGHAGATMAATVEVLTLSGSAVATVKLRNWGAYSNRLATATVSAAGTNYSVGDILEVVGGTARERGRLSVATLSGSGVATVTIHEGGGAYSVAPSGTLATTLVGPSTGTGTGATFTITMTGLIGTTGAATTGGTGTGCTLNLTLTETGWTALRNRSNYSFNGINNEREIVLEGTVAGGTTPIVGMRTYTATVATETRRGILLSGFTGYSDGTSYDAQVGAGPTTVPGFPGSHVPLLNTSMPAWFAVNSRRIFGGIKTQGTSVLAYQTFYLGLGAPFGTATENPYPLLVFAPNSDKDEVPDSTSYKETGITEAAAFSAATNSPLSFRRITTATWVQVCNSASGSVSTTHNLFPTGRTGILTSNADPRSIGLEGTLAFYLGICQVDRSPAALLLKPAYGTNETVRIPVILLRTPSGDTNDVNTDVHCALEGVSWVSGTKSDGTAISAEDTFTQGSTRHRVFQNGAQTQRYHFFAVAEE